MSFDTLLLSKHFPLFNILVYLDNDGVQCQVANFQIGPDTSKTRKWDIQVTQYNCGDEDNGGPPGCLQYFTGTSGNVADYGFSPSIVATTTITASCNFRFIFGLSLIYFRSFFGLFSVYFQSIFSVFWSIFGLFSV